MNKSQTRRVRKGLRRRARFRLYRLFGGQCAPEEDLEVQKSVEGGLVDKVTAASRHPEGPVEGLDPIYVPCTPPGTPRCGSYTWVLDAPALTKRLHRALFPKRELPKSEEDAVLDDGDLDELPNDLDGLEYLYQKMESSSGTKRFDAAVELMYEARKSKESLLHQKKRDEGALDMTDLYEAHACAACYGLFLYSLGLNDGQSVPFSKSEVDERMESAFGSLESSERDFTEENILEARLLFSCYLARKIWSPVPWRKFDEALKGFLTRVVDSEIEAPVDEDAMRTAAVILELLMTFGPDPDLYRDREPNSDSACLEKNKKSGGKRSAMYEEKKTGLGFKYVIPKAIYTGGKIRVITISSFLSSNYLWINKWLGACVRKLECSIFGGDVKDWWKRVGDRFVVRDGEVYVSGDLESATDLFDGRITNKLLERMAGFLGMDEAELEDMKSFTTSCNFKVGSDFYRQTRGNMMGSEISFPFLCIFSLAAYICKNDELRDKLIGLYTRRKKRQAFQLLSELRLGVNGDDVVFPAENADFWLRGVAAIGGKVSKGKSLVNPYFFTVNSELWSSHGQLFVARPTFLTAIHDGRKYFVSPTREFLEYDATDLFVDHSVFDVERRLNLDIPVRWGGLGLVRSFDPYRAALWKFKSEHERASSRLAPLKGSARAIQENDKIREELKAQGGKVLVRLSRSMREAYQKVYRSTAASWKDKNHVRYNQGIPAAARYFISNPENRRSLYREWKKLMVREDECVMEIPAGLVRVFRCVLLVSQEDYRVALPSKGEYGKLKFDRSKNILVYKGVPVVRQLF